MPEIDRGQKHGSKNFSRHLEKQQRPTFARFCGYSNGLVSANSKVMKIFRILVIALGLCLAAKTLRKVMLTVITPFQNGLT